MSAHADVGNYQFTQWAGGPLKGGQGFQQWWFTVSDDDFSCFSLINPTGVFGPFSCFCQPVSPHLLLLHHLGSFVWLETGNRQRGLKFAELSDCLVSHKSDDAFCCWGGGGAPSFR